MDGNTKKGTLLETSKVIDILFYIRNNPNCKKTDIYRNVTRNVYIPTKIEEMGEMGLIVLGEAVGSRATLLSLTDKGVRLTDLLLEAESLLDETVDQ